MSSTTMRSEFRLKSSALLVFFIFVMKFSGEVDAACQQDWGRFLGNCYKLIASRATYPEALGFCERNGYNLLTIESDAENYFIQSFLTNKADSVWMGISDLFQEGHWIYTSRAEDRIAWALNRTRTPVTFTKWVRGEPNNAGEEDCGEFYANGNWNDCRCEARIFFVCKEKYED